MPSSAPPPTRWPPRPALTQITREEKSASDAVRALEGEVRVLDERIEAEEKAGQLAAAQREALRDSRAYQERRFGQRERPAARRARRRRGEDRCAVPPTGRRGAAGDRPGRGYCEAGKNLDQAERAVVTAARTTWLATLTTPAWWRSRRGSWPIATLSGCGRPRGSAALPPKRPAQDRDPRQGGDRVDARRDGGRGSRPGSQGSAPGGRAGAGGGRRHHGGRRAAFRVGP